MVNKNKELFHLGELLVTVCYLQTAMIFPIWSAFRWFGRPPVSCMIHKILKAAKYEIQKPSTCRAT